MQLTTALESPNEEYLSDYAYIDSVRLSHYYGQLSKDGLITQSKQSSKNSGKDTGNISLKAMVVSGLAQTELGSEQAVEHTIDPTFSRPQETLDALFERGYLGTDLPGAGIGKLVLIKGRVSVFDIRLMKEIWQYMGEMIGQESGADAPTQKDRQRIQAAKKKEFDRIAQIISKLPHSIQGTFLTDDHEAWFTLEPAHMRINPEDIVFKHGCDLPGEWHMLGIVDARPDDEPDFDVIARVSSDIENGLRLMLTAMRNSLGRPAHRFGITPLIIFRTVRQATNASSDNE